MWSAHGYQDLWIKKFLDIFSGCSLRNDTGKIRLNFFFVYSDGTGFSWRGSMLVCGEHCFCGTIGQDVTQHSSLQPSDNNWGGGDSCAHQPSSSQTVRWQVQFLFSLWVVWKRNFRLLILTILSVKGCKPSSILAKKLKQQAGKVSGCLSESELTPWLVGTPGGL